MKTEVYSWRLDANFKTELEAEARRRKKSFGALLDEFAHEGMRKARSRRKDDQAEQARLHALVEKFIGTVPLGMGPYTNARVHEVVCQNLEKKYGRKRPH